MNVPNLCQKFINNRLKKDFYFIYSNNVSNDIALSRLYHGFESRTRYHLTIAPLHKGVFIFYHLSTPFILEILIYLNIQIM